MISSSALASIPRPGPSVPDGGLWGRKQDCELLINIYEEGCVKSSAVDKDTVSRMTNLMKLLTEAT
jgi:hypothetical protein